MRSRRIIASFFGLIPDPVEAFQILYRTTSINGSAIATVTTVFKPLVHKKDRFIAYNTALDSSGDGCNPSHAFQLGSGVIPGITTTSGAELLRIQLYLLKGYVVSIADYEGPDTSWISGHLTAMGVLDSMRAVSRFKTLGLNNNPGIVGTGYSGGGFATAWAAAIHPVYAPELPVKGWMAGGVPADLEANFRFLDNTVASGFLFAGLAGLLKPSAYGAQLQPIVDKYITPKGQQALALANRVCAVPILLAYPFQSLLGTKYQSLGPELFNIPIVKEVFHNNTLGVYKAETPTAPILMYHGTLDEIVSYPPAEAAKNAWCENGATVRFIEYAAGAHGTTGVLGSVEASRFLDEAFDGEIEAGCTSKTVSDHSLNPLALGLLLEPVVVGLINALVTAGPRDANWINGIKTGNPI